MPETKKNLISVELNLDNIWTDDGDNVVNVINDAIRDAVKDEIRQIHKKTIQEHSKSVIREVVLSNFNEIITDGNFAAHDFWSSKPEVEAKNFKDFVKQYVKAIYGRDYDFKQKIENLIKKQASKEVERYITESSGVVLDVISGFKADFNAKISEVLSKQFKVTDLFDKLFQQHIPIALASDKEVEG